MSTTSNDNNDTQHHHPGAAVGIGTSSTGDTNAVGDNLRQEMPGTSTTNATIAMAMRGAAAFAPPVVTTTTPTTAFQQATNFAQQPEHAGAVPGRGGNMHGAAVGGGSVMQQPRYGCELRTIIIHRIYYMQTCF
jgi:hypothetical protein